jgi:flagellar export protein FliJ
MAPFSFRLEKVLRHRAYMEKKVRGQVSETLNKVKHLETVITGIHDTRTEAAKAQAEERSRGISVSRDQLHASFLLGLAERAAEERSDLEKSKEELELLRKLLSIAAAKKKSLESLKDVHLKRYKEQSEKTEQKLLDDLVVMTRKERET